MLPVVRTERAESDLCEILTYLEEYSPKAAEEFAAAIDERCALLGEMPLLGRPREELAQGLRSMLVKGHVYFYRVTHLAVEMVRILHFSRDIDSIMSNEPPYDK